MQSPTDGTTSQTRSRVFGVTLHAFSKVVAPARLLLGFAVSHRLHQLRLQLQPPIRAVRSHLPTTLPEAVPPLLPLLPLRLTPLPTYPLTTLLLVAPLLRILRAITRNITLLKVAPLLLPRPRARTAWPLLPPLHRLTPQPQQYLRLFNPFRRLSTKRHKRLRHRVPLRPKCRARHRVRPNPLKSQAMEACRTNGQISVFWQWWRVGFLALLSFCELSSQSHWKG